MVKLSVNEASEILGISPDGVRKRIQRGSLEANKEQDGTWTVLLDKETVQDVEQDKGVNVLVADLKALETLNERQNEEIERLYQQIQFLQKELENRTEEIKRKDSLLLNLQNKLPQLAPPKQSIFTKWFNKE